MSSRPEQRVGVIGRRYPVRVVAGGGRRSRQRTLGARVRTAALLALAAGLVAYLSASPAVGGGSPANAATAGGSHSFSSVSTTTRGIVGDKINVVFPVITLTSVVAKLSGETTYEFKEQEKAIKFFVHQVNQQGGIHGKKINPIIATFTPEKTAEMRSLCKDWTEGSPAAFAVVDGIGAWSGTNQLCVAEEGHTPLISDWTTVSTWTKEAAPYLWWIGPAQTTILQATVNWGLSAGLLGGSQKVGVIAGNRASDQAALKKYLLPDLKRAGVTPVVETIAAQPTEQNETSTQATLVIEKLKSAGVTSVIPIVPFNAFIPLMNAEKNEDYQPKLLLSDYEQTIVDSLGLIPTLYETELNGQEGVTTETIGGVTTTRPENQGGYDPGVRSCYTAWHKAFPQPVGKVNTYTLEEPGPTGKDTLHHISVPKSYYIEEQGAVQAWCIAVKLFATAARDAGPDLNRRSFVEAMAKIKNFPGGASPVLSYGPDRFSGPTKYRIVELHNNTPTSSACDLLHTGNPQGTCWVVKSTWKPLPT